MSEYKIYQPQKYAIARTMDVLKEALNNPNYALTLKKDGCSYIWAKDLDGSVHLYGDHISKKDGRIIDKIDRVPHLEKFAKDFFPKGSQLIVEICYNYDWNDCEIKPRSNSKYVNSIMLSSPAKAIARQNQTSPCQAYVFDVLFWDEQPIFKQDFADRYGVMMKIKEELPAESWLEYSELFIENKGEKITEWITNGEEGGVLKKLHTDYISSAAHAVSEIGETAKRPMHTTYKIKQIDTVDVVILGVEYPSETYTGKFENARYFDENGNPVNRLYALNMVNAFVIGAYDKFGETVEIGTVASGLNDEIRADAFANPHDYIGTVIECDCMSIDKFAKTLRHARYMRSRPDKDAHACLIEDIFARGE